MATVIEIDWFNTYLLKKCVDDNFSADLTTPQSLPNQTNVPGGMLAPADGYPLAPGVAYPGTITNSDFNYYVEESRIRGGYNNKATDKGVKAYINEPQPQQQHRFNSLIYSGVYNSRTGVNDTNVFSVAEDLVRSADPQNGSIQRIYAEDTNLIVFQEDKVSRALIDKDTIYTTEGGTQTQAGQRILGQIVPYKGEYGISKNPESFAVYGYRKYFADKDRNAIMRLSNDGLTEISAYGMTDYFRDQLALMSSENRNFVVEGSLKTNTTAANVTIGIANATLTSSFESTSITPGMIVSFCPDITVANPVFQNLPGYITQVKTNSTGVQTTVYMSSPLGVSQASGANVKFRFSYPYRTRVIGGWDIHNKNYLVSMQDTPTQIDKYNKNTYRTLTFDESIKGWVSFKTFKPAMMNSLKNNFYSFTNADLYEHYDETTLNNRGLYYDVREPSNVTFVFNPSPSTVKVFKTIDYEGSNGWEVTSFVSSFTEPNLNVTTGSYSNDQDTSSFIYSYDQGLYTNSVTGQPQRAGFDRKEDRYVANIVNSSTITPGEIRFGADMTGIKGYFATVTIETDSSTELGGIKELWATGSEYIISST
jgi:hypothetical protein